jgi:ferritin
MMIDKKMTNGLNAQIGREFAAAMQYVAMGAWFEGKGLAGFAKFFFAQGAEEYEHGLKMVRYLGEVGGHVALPAIEKPRDKFGSVTEAIEQFLSMEEGVTKAIYELVDLATAEKDHSAFEFLQWYVSEQREEVASAGSLLERVKHFGEERAILLDGSLGGGGGHEG